MEGVLAARGLTYGIPLLHVLGYMSRMAYEATVPAWFNTRKAAQVTAWFALKAGGRINVLKATKLIYLADRLSMEKRDCPITGDNFVSMKYGPVNTYTYSYMCGAAPAKLDEWREFIAPRENWVLPLARQIRMEDLDEISRADLRILDETWALYSDIDRFELAEWTHKYCPEWRDPSGSSIPIDFATVFKRLDKEDPVSLSEEIQAERGLRLSLMGDA